MKPIKAKPIETACKTFKYSSIKYNSRSKSIRTITNSKCTTTVRLGATMKEKDGVFVKFTRTIKRRRLVTKITGRINHFTKKKRRSARSRSYSPDSSDFGNSPIKSVGDKRDPSRTPSPTRSASPARNQERFYLAIGNLTRNVNEGHLKEIFGIYGEILEVSYPMHPNTGYPTGKAVIEYSTAVALESAINGMNGGQIDGNSIECSVSKYSTPFVKVNREREVYRKPFGNNRGRAPRRGGDHYAPIRRDRSRSPIRRRSFSRSRSPMRRRRDFSPMRRSPMRRVSRSRSSVRRFSRSRSPVRRFSRSRSPVRHFSRSRSPVRRFSRSRSPVRRFSRSPMRSRSPVRRYSRSPRARSPARRRSPSFSRSRSRSPRFNRRYTPSPRRFSPRRRSPSRSPVPISRMNY